MFKRYMYVFFLMVIPGLSWTFPQLNDAYPDPILRPDEIVRLQLLAMQHNNVSDSGIEITFRFASPENKKNTGPLEHFILLLKKPVYRHLLNHLDTTFLDLKIKNDVAIQDVIITTASMARIGYRFRLSLQKDAEYKNCWMTDAVIPFLVPEISA